MKKLMSGIMIVGFLISPTALAADVSNSAQKPMPTATEGKLTVEQPETVAQRSNCITQTGSRLKSKDKNGCNGLPGRSYTKADIDLTGATTLAEALQRLDPAISLGR